MTRKAAILVIDDNESHARVVAEGLEREGHDTLVATSGDEGLEKLRGHTVDVVVTDLVMHGTDGLKVLEEALRLDPGMQVILVTGHGTVESAVDAMRKGAFNYLLKPLDINELRVVVANALEKRGLIRRNRELEERLDGKFGFEGLIGSSPAMQQVYGIMQRVARTGATILILGETGTGKELVAKAIHQNSPRKNRPFVALNCAALSKDILESELFGHEKGAFTGAVSAREGLFEYADGGTLLLDEVSDMPAETQVKLLRVLEDGEVRRVGSNESVRVDVRVLAATNTELTPAVDAGTFRQDLYYRLKVVTIKLPPLRERPEDIPVLIDHFLKEFCEEHGKPSLQLSTDTRRILLRYPWPGNVRELRNCIENMVVMATAEMLEVGDIPEHIHALPPEKTRAVELSAPMSLSDAEEKLIKDTLELTGGNREETARILGIGERTLYRKLKLYGLS
ncbi:MAG TPA: sigma-54 dependent transcriptional regulator [Planctomycetota bacterium]|nr:sigma-54 dependent transcriptional regulator [Planctomycetota bacterium]